MSGKARAVPPLEPTLCELCKGPLSERRAKFYLEVGSGGRFGPYHAGCAWKLSEQYKKAEVRMPIPFTATPLSQRTGREETLPW